MAHYKGAASEGGRAAQLMKKRELEQQEIEFRKKKLEEELKLNNIENKFATHYDAVEQQLKTSTIGLVTLDQMKAKQEDIVREREKKLALKKDEKDKELQKALEARQQEKNKQMKQINSLSFAFDEEEEEEEGTDEKHQVEDESNEKKSIQAESLSTDEGESSEVPGNSKTKKMKWTEEGESFIPKKIRKNPDVDTSFLPDREREEQENRLREELRQEWVAQQSELKEQEIPITFSYWDGSGHRKQLSMKKGHTIYQFLQKCLEVLRRDFSELKTVMADQLMYVKEDLILPHHYSFYDFIVTKARGKSGPLFQFDVHDDIRMISDATKEKEESHAGKVLMRSWYERNKHIFPASRWEPYDPTKVYDKYTIKDKKGEGKK